MLLLRARTQTFLVSVAIMCVVGAIASSAVWASGPYWRVGGTDLTQGSKQDKLQSKGPTVITLKIGETFVIECRGNASEGATIEGHGTAQGQGKGRLVFTSCATNVGCPVVEPLVTVQLKTHLVTFNGAQSKYADLYEPAAGTAFMTIRLLGGCKLTIPVTGRLAAEVLPKEAEAQEGSLYFPEGTITPVFLEGAQIKPRLQLASEEVKFVAYYGFRLASGEKFGIFPN